MNKKEQAAFDALRNKRRDSVKTFWREYCHRFGVELDNDAADFVIAYAEKYAKEANNQNGGQDEGKA